MSGEQTIRADGFEAILVRKAVKHVRVTILPPDGAVRVTAPNRFPEARIKAFLADHADWIRTHSERVREKHRDEPRFFDTGETVRVFGVPFTLLVTEGQKKNAVFPDGDRIVLALKGGSTPEKRKALLDAWRKERLQAEIKTLLPRWSERTGLVPSAWTVRDMTSRWGSCNPKTGRITLNLQLSRFPAICLEYVILHELAHLKVHGHGPDFKTLLTEYMPDWKERRKRLNA
ncbi:MAG: M48 family metallopeptidase [Clostridia bacterium]|nr:M48 family metallopeptidase [Clostridia bacterium]